MGAEGAGAFGGYSGELLQLGKYSSHVNGMRRVSAKSLQSAVSS